MAQLWTKAEYAITNWIYDDAVARRAKGERVSLRDLVARCKQGTGRIDDGSCRMHLQNLTAARRDTGLATLPEVAPLENYPQKLLNYLKSLNQ